MTAFEAAKGRLLKLTRARKEPIITPREGRVWEAGGTFNPGAVVDRGCVHLLYRAVDANGVSRFGYSRVQNGTEVDLRSWDPVFEPSAQWEESGCEDPRITEFDGTFYIAYTAFSWRGPRMALASTRDFVNFEKYGLVGPDCDDKDWVIFPERIDGRMAMLHRLESRVQIVYFESFESLRDSYEFWKEYLKHLNDYEVMRGKCSWEAKKIGVGPPPVKTDLGWLVIYHGVSIDGIYRVGAALLDLDNPSKVLARTNEPILEPEMGFEKHGVVPNVVFPCGAVVLDGKLWVYYGGADESSCVANAPFNEFLDELERSAW